MYGLLYYLKKKRPKVGIRRSARLLRCTQTKRMTKRFYDVLEDLLGALDEWNASPHVSKGDIVDSVRERVLMLMTHVVTTPLIGTAFAYPGDIDAARLDAWLARSATDDAACG